MSDVVLTSAEDGVLVITLNRPEAKNAANKALAEGVAAAIDELESNPARRCTHRRWRHVLLGYGPEGVRER